MAPTVPARIDPPRIPTLAESSNVVPVKGERRDEQGHRVCHKTSRLLQSNVTRKLRNPRSTNPPRHAGAAEGSASRRRLGPAREAEWDGPAVLVLSVGGLIATMGMNFPRPPGKSLRKSATLVRAPSSWQDARRANGRNGAIHSRHATAALIARIRTSRVPWIRCVGTPSVEWLNGTMIACVRCSPTEVLLFCSTTRCGPWDLFADRH
jgi:hypothetical protein